MKRGMNLVERAIIESLAKHKRTINQLVQDIGVSKEWTLAIINNLRSKNFVSYDRSIFYLSQENIELIKEIDIKGEIIEIADTLVDRHFRDEKTISLAKLSMTDSEYEIYSALKSNLESYVNEIKSKKRNLEETRSQRVFLMADTQYENLLSTYLASNL